MFRIWKIMQFQVSQLRELQSETQEELDACYARLYGLMHDELRYILDPKEVYVEDFPRETFRVLKAKEIKQFGGGEKLRQAVDDMEKFLYESQTNRDHFSNTKKIHFGDGAGGRRFRAGVCLYLQQDGMA